LVVADADQKEGLADLPLEDSEISVGSSDSEVLTAGQFLHLSLVEAVHLRHPVSQSVGEALFSDLVDVQVLRVVEHIHAILDVGNENSSQEGKLLKVGLDKLLGLHLYYIISK
jgi:hypothetical protein